MMKRRQQQDGFVSIIMALIIMVLVSLIALGFAFLARQNQTQSQNRELSTQAYYAAESGVNDAVDYLKKQLKTTGSLPNDVTSCATATQLNTVGGYASAVGSVNPDVKYTCVLYNTAPTSLEYSVDTSNSKIVQVRAASGNISSITISWQDASGSQTFANNSLHLLPQTGATVDNLASSTGIIRATFIPGNNLTRAVLTNNAQTVFLYPKAGTAAAVNSQAYGTGDAQQGSFVDGNCNTGKTPKYCSVTINSLSGSPVWYLRLRSIYRASNVTISATSGGSAAKLVNEQAVIDATGKASNVVRRIQVRVPLRNSANYPEYAAETTDSLCKRLLVWPNGADYASLTSFGITVTSELSCRAF